MKQYVRLFAAAGLGGIVGGSITHSAVASHGHVASFWITLLGLVLGSFIASFIFDPKGTMEVTKQAFKLALPIAGSAGKGLASVIGLIIKGIVYGSIKVAFFALCLVISAATWYVVGYGIAQYAEVAPGDIRRFSMFAALVVAFPLLLGASRIQANRDTSDDLIDCPLGVFFGAVGDALWATNSISVGILVLGWIWTCIKGCVWLAKNFPRLVVATVYFGLYLTVGLTKCRLRTAAIVGVAIGTASGLFTGNPIYLGVLSGSSAVVIHFVSARYRKVAMSLLAAINLHWSEVNEGKTSAS